MTDPEQLADGLESIIPGAEPALTDEELNAIRCAIDYLRMRAMEVEADA